MAGEIQVDPIFFHFRKDNEGMKGLQQALVGLKQDDNVLKVLTCRALRIKTANACAPGHFAEARCSVTHPDDKYYTCGSIFLDGLVVLEAYREDDFQLPIDEKTRMALAKLLQFLSSSNRAKAIKTTAVINESPTDKLIRELREENARLMEILKAGGGGAAMMSMQGGGVSNDANRAKAIKTTAVINESPTDKLIRELREENARLMEILKAGGGGAAMMSMQGGGVSNDAHSELTSTVKDDSECYWAWILAEHLLSKLSVVNSYKINEELDKPSSMDIGIEERQKMKEKYGDTSFGVEDRWHGSVDILMVENASAVNVVVPLTTAVEDDVPMTAVEDDVTMTAVEDDVPMTAVEDDKSSSSDSLSEQRIKREDFQDTDLEQMMATTIVFSFLQNKQGGGSHKSLVPTVGISRDKLVAFFYDCENDILLHTTSKIPLFSTDDNKRELAVLPVVFLWLVLNFKQFCTGIVEEMKEEKANFFSICNPNPSKLHVYLNQVQRPLPPRVRVPRSEPVDLFEFDENASVTRGTPAQGYQSAKLFKPKLLG